VVQHLPILPNHKAFRYFKDTDYLSMANHKAFRYFKDTDYLSMVYAYCHGQTISSEENFKRL